jgi:protein tyrosine/serine phosphatase
MPGNDPTARSATPDETSRHVFLEGAWNFRDLGGYAGQDGRCVRWQRLYRADSLHRLTAADLARLSSLRMRTVIDLRTSSEVAKGRVPADLELVAWHHVPVIDVLPPRDAYDRWATPSEAARQYLAMFEGASSSVTAFLGLICDETSYPLVYHCFAGKDRTGVLTALVLGLLGVADDDIAADYALSTLAMQHLLEWLQEQYGGSTELQASAPAILSADPATMAAFLEQFRAAHGSFEAYATQLGHPDAGARLQAILLEP